MDTILAGYSHEELELPGTVGRASRLGLVNMERVVGVAFASAPMTDNPNIRGRNQAVASQNYFQAMTCLFGSVRRWNKEIFLELITDAEPPGFFLAAVAKFDLRIIKRAFEYRPPQGYASHFNTSLYLLDALEVYSHSSADISIAIVDPDVLCIKPLDPMFDAAFSAIGAYPLDFPPSVNINGLSRNQAVLLHSELDKRPYEVAPHYGGELLLVQSSSVAPLVDRCRGAFEFSLQRSRCNQLRFTTEEHILSYALRNEKPVDMAPFIRRIHTSRTCRSVTGDEFACSLWHIPAEKGRGFSRLFPYVLNHDSWFWQSSQEEFARNSAAIMGIRRTPSRAIIDSAAIVVRAVDERIRAATPLGRRTGK
jgi:hypothetical protein